MSNIFFGIPNGVIEGQYFENRMALVKAGLHRSTQRGIDGNKNDGTAAIILSGGYEDDKDYEDEIIYTGEGGNDRETKRQIANQSWESPGNKGLLISKEKNLPVRVIRGYTHKSPFSPKEGYQFAGLFKVVDCWEEVGKSDFKICRFRLSKIESSKEDKDTKLDSINVGCLVLLEIEGKEPKWYGIGTEGPKAIKLNVDRNLTKHLFGKKVGESFEFGSKFKVLEIKKYKSI